MTRIVEKFSHSDRMELAVKIPLRLDGQKSKQYPYAPLLHGEKIQDNLAAVRLLGMYRSQVY